MRGRARAHGAGTIVNAIASGRGAAFGLDLVTEAEVELDGSGEVKVIIEGFAGEDPLLAERCVRNVLEREARKEGHGATVITRSQIPVSRGLKSSSAAANAIVLATYQALGREVEALQAVRIGTRSAIEAKVSVTGAFDDACASMLGGVVLTDNRRERLVRRARLPEGLRAVVHVPGFQVRKRDLPLERIRAIAPAAEQAFALARRSRYPEAMLINSLAYASALGLGLEPVYAALGEGAYAAGLSGTGPAIVILVRAEGAERMRALLPEGETMVVELYQGEEERA